jgi:hypothetical protein
VYVVRPEIEVVEVQDTPLLKSVYAVRPEMDRVVVPVMPLL